MRARKLFGFRPGLVQGRSPPEAVIQIHEGSEGFGEFLAQQHHRVAVERYRESRFSVDD